MKNRWRKLYQCEVLRDYIMLGAIVLFWGGFLLFQIARDASGTGFPVGKMRVAVAVFLGIVFLGGIFLYKKTASYIHWYKEIFDSVPMPLIITDQDAKWRQANKAARDSMDLQQYSDFEKFSSRHLLQTDESVTDKIWVHAGVEYRITVNRLCGDGKDTGYLIFLNNTNELFDTYKTRAEVISEINRLFRNLSSVSDHFYECASTLSEYTIWQGGVIIDLSEIITGMASGKLDHAGALHEKMRAVKENMQQNMGNSQMHLERMRRIIEELDAARDSIRSAIQADEKAV